MSGAYTFIGMYAPFSLLRLPVAEKSRSPHSSTTTGLLFAANLPNNHIADPLFRRKIEGGSSRRRFQETDENKVARADRATHHHWRL